MSVFLVGLILILVGLAGVFWGFRIFRILLPIMGGVAGYLLGFSLLPNNPLLALIVGFGLALLFIILAYAIWSVWITISGIFLGAALGVAIAQGLNLWTVVGWTLILILAVLGGVVVWRIREEAVIILTAIAGAGFVADGLRLWLGLGSFLTYIWLVIFVVLAIVGIVWQWRRYRHLELVGFGGPAEKPGAMQAAPAAPAAAPMAAAAVAVAAAAPEPEEEPVAFEAAVVNEAEAAGAMEEPEVTSDGTEAAALQEKVGFVEGIGPAYGAKLNEAGIVVVLDLLNRGATRKGRAELVEATGIASGLIMKWVNHADLFRVKGVSKQFAELLEAAGVDSVPELAQRNAVNLFTRLGEVNAEKNLTGRSPYQSEVDSWVSQAKTLPRVIEY
jgi:predicted flap endonuclease-1-like 5' DNA nuclease